MINKFKNTCRKNYLVIVLLGLSLSTSLFSGCSKDDEENIDPAVRTQFLGYYSVEDDDEGDITQYSIAILESSKGNNIIEISNFADFMNVNIIANVEGNKMTIPSQTFPNSKNTYTITLTGTGTLNGSFLNYQYNIHVDEKNDDDWDFGGVCVATRNND